MAESVVHRKILAETVKKSLRLRKETELVRERAFALRDAARMAVMLRARP